MKISARQLSAILGVISLALAICSVMEYLSVRELRKELDLARSDLQLAQTRLRETPRHVPEPLEARIKIAPTARTEQVVDDNDLTKPTVAAAAFKVLKRLEDPEVQALLSEKAAMDVERIYGPFLDKLKVVGSQRTALVKLLAEREQSGTDVFLSATKMGIDPTKNPREFAAIKQQVASEFNQQIESVVGADGRAQLQGYESTIPVRSLVSELQQDLFFSHEPLTPQQADHLIGSLSAPVNKSLAEGRSLNSEVTLPGDLTKAQVQAFYKVLERSNIKNRLKVAASGKKASK